MATRGSAKIRRDHYHTEINMNCHALVADECGKWRRRALTSPRSGSPPRPAVSTDDNRASVFNAMSRGCWSQDKLPHRFSETIILIAIRNRACLRFHFIAGISYSNGKAARAKHEHVIRHVPDCGNLARSNIEKLGQGGHDCSLVGFWISHIKIVGLRTSSARSLAQSALSDFFAICHQLKVIGDTDYLHSSNQLFVAEGRHNICLEPYHRRLARNMRSVLVADEPVIRGVYPNIKIMIDHQLEGLPCGRDIDSFPG
ncbi:hypothetical protein ACVIYL_003065 [Bradyrhizobium sp. USDA 3315]